MCSSDLVAPPPPADPVGPLAAPVRLRADHHRASADVLGGTGPAPALSWEIPAAPAGWTQARAEVEITRGPFAGATITETIALDGSSQLFHPWPCTPLASRERAAWRVRVAGPDGVLSPWSAPAVVETGLLERSDWTARPIAVPGNAH